MHIGPPPCTLYPTAPHNIALQFTSLHFIIVKCSPPSQLFWAALPYDARADISIFFFTKKGKKLLVAEILTNLTENFIQ